MADLTQTPGNVAIYDNKLNLKKVQVGEAVTQGMPGYKATDGLYYQTDADAEASAAASGIFLTPASANEYASFAEDTGNGGLINLGATLTKGTAYYVSQNKGAICLYSDLASGDYVTLLGIAATTSLLKVGILVLGDTKP